MSTSYQNAVLQDIERIAADAGHGVMTEWEFSNVGRILIGTPSKIELTIDCRFQTGGSNMLLINGAKHGPAGPDNYYMTATDTDRYGAFIARIKELLK